MPNPVHKREIKYSSDDGHPWEEENKDDKGVYASAKPKVEVSVPGEFLYDKPLKWYFEVVVWPMFILVILEIGIRVMQTKYFLNIKPEIFEWLINFVRAFLLSYLSAMAIKKFFGNKKQILTVGVIGGLIAGIILAVFQLFWYFELWTFFNLLGLPLMLALEGLVIGWLVFIVFKIKDDRNK